MNNLLFVASYAAAVLGQFSDAWTTEIALGKGFKEVNPIGAWLISKLGVGGTYPVKCAALPALAAILAAFGLDTAAISVLGIIAAAGFIVGVRNFIVLRKSGVSLSEIL